MNKEIDTPRLFSFAKDRYNLYLTEKEHIINWNNTSEDKLDLGMLFSFYFTQGHKVFLENPERISEIVNEQKFKGIPKSYEMVLSRMNEFSLQGKNPSVKNLNEFVKYNEYMICPVRIATEQEIQECRDYKKKLESQGLKILYPYDDTNQEDTATGGYRICQDHTFEIVGSQRVGAYLNSDSKGSFIDLGTYLTQRFSRDSPFYIINREQIKANQEFCQSDLGKLVLYLDSADVGNV